MAKFLTELLAGIPWRGCQKTSDFKVKVSGLSSDSREIGAGMVFVALTGLKEDGHQYIAQARAGGCAAVVVEAGNEVDLSVHDAVPVVEVADSRLALAAMAAAFYNHPARRMVMIGITGTNGKTTTTYLLEAVIKESGGNPGVIGTINYRFNGQEFPALFTTPEPVLLQGLLQQMAAAGVTHVIMEVSSHALAQKRLAGLEFDIALFTNLSRDHLDFHGSMDAYYQVKKGLFRQLKGNGYAVVLAESAAGADSSWGGRLLTELRLHRQNAPANDAIISCGFDAALDVSAGHINYDISGTTAELDVMGQRLLLRSGLAGEFNLKNIIGAVGVAAALHLDLERVKMGLLNSGRPPGRLERIGAAMAADGKDERPEVFVDYAHTPDAMENVLRTLKKLGNGRLLVVFGCGGDRDKGKRYLMGRLAGQLADTIIITADNSRSESTALIMAEIERGVKSAGHGCYFSIANRAQAIARAIELAGAGDVVLIAGKGHEDYQISRAGRAAFSDRLEVEKQLSAGQGNRGQKIEDRGQRTDDTHRGD